MTNNQESLIIKLDIPIKSTIIFNSRLFDNNFKIISDTEYFISKKEVLPSKTPSIALIVYAEPLYYFKGYKHLPMMTTEKGLDLYGQIFKQFFCREDVSKIFVGHYHDKKGKCYVQLCLILQSPLRNRIPPGSFKIDTKETNIFKDITFIYMRQRMKSFMSINTFISQEKNLYTIEQENEPSKQFDDNLTAMNVSSIAPMEDISCFLSNKNMIDNIFEETNKENKGANYNNTNDLSTYPSLETNDNQKNCDFFDWNVNDYIFSRFPQIKKWFFHHCEPKGLRKRKSLLLFSKMKNVGKKYFAQSLVYGKCEFYIVIKDYHDLNVFISKNIPKLIIIDEINEISLEIHKKLWIKILSGQHYYDDLKNDFYWQYNIPCVITTTNLDCVKKLFLDKTFRDIIIFQEVDDSFIQNNSIIERKLKVENNFSSSLRFDI